MAQFLDFNSSSFLLYYTRPHLSGTPEFEHKVRVNIADISHPKNRAGKADEDALAIECPCGCGLKVWVPVDGDREAQELHVRAYAAIRGVPIAEAAAEIAERVAARGGEPRIAAPPEAR